MSSFDDLDGAFKSLSDTLQNRLSPYFSEAVSAAWLGELAHAAAIARETAEWNALPVLLPDADGLVAQIDSSARAVASADIADDKAIIAALAKVTQALALLETYLDRSAGP